VVPSNAGMGSLIADLRYAARELRRRPGFAATAILSLALGIGATSAVFSVIYGVLINPFPLRRRRPDDAARPQGQHEFQTVLTGPGHAPTAQS